MDPLLLAALGFAGLLVGATGTWSPCGFSMIETIGPTGHEGGLPTTLAASITFGPFAVLGGAITFGLLALLGELIGGAGGPVAYALAALIALAAALAEARGVPIVPQVRRQLPVGWRSTMPMPVAAAGYGVLLGLGFTTFVLSYGVWALMGIVLAVGDPLAGLVAGIAFGVGRAVPIVVLAPLADRPSGERACEAMATRPGLLRGARIGDAVALLALAAALGGSAAAEASKNEVGSAADPSTAGPALVYEPNGGGAVLRRAQGTKVDLPGGDPATGGALIATVQGGSVAILRRETLDEIARVPAAGADGLAVGASWLAVRTRRSGRDRVAVIPLGKEGRPIGRARKVAAAKRPAQLSRPAVDGNRLVLAVAKPKRNMLVRYRLRANGKPGRRVLLSSPSFGISAPSVEGAAIAYVRTTRRKQALMVKGLGKGRGHSIYRRGQAPPTLWSTSISGKRVFATVAKRGGRSKIVSAGR